MAKTDSISAAVEDYAKAIYALQVERGGAVTNNALAERLGVSAASASNMVKKLGGLGLVEHLPYRGGELTPRGRRGELESADESGATLDTLEPGDEGRFTRVSDHDPEMLRYLARRGIAPGDDF